MRGRRAVVSAAQVGAGCCCAPQRGCRSPASRGDHPVFLQAALSGTLPPALGVTWIGCDRGRNCTACPKRRVGVLSFGLVCCRTRCAPGMCLISTLASLAHLGRPTFRRQLFSLILLDPEALRFPLKQDTD